MLFIQLGRIIQSILFACSLDLPQRVGSYSAPQGNKIK